MNPAIQAPNLLLRAHLPRLPPLRLSVALHGAPVIGPALLQAAWHRDLHVCAWCGFRALRYQDAELLQGSGRDLDQIVTACAFCRQCLHLDELKHTRSGVLIWLPEITQTDLHHLAREIYLARLSRDAHALGRRAIEHLMARRAGARERLLDSHDPAELARRLIEAGPDQADTVLPDALRHGLRLLPLDRRILTIDELEFNQFPQTLAYWRSAQGPFHRQRAYAHVEAFLALMDAGAALN